MASSFQVQDNKQQQAPVATTGNSSDKATNQLFPGSILQGTDVLKAIAGMMGMLLEDGTLVLGSDGKVKIRASISYTFRELRYPFLNI